jgi:two-component system, OmpR family, sensor kinase
MYIPLPLRLTLFYAFIVGLALWFFGITVYNQAEQRVYNDLDNTLSNRAASVRLGKDLFPGFPSTTASPLILPSVDGLGAGGVAIEVFDDQQRLLATTIGDQNNGIQTGVADLGSSPIPWDVQAIHYVTQHYPAITHTYSTITYQGQHVRVYTLVNNDFGSMHIIQTARSEQDIEQSLSNLQQLLLRGSALVMTLALLGGWLMTWGVLIAVRRMTKTAQHISNSRDFRKRVYNPPWLARDELTTLADTFNAMLASLQEVYQRQQRFIADASHELRAPITSIRCNLDLLAKAPDLPAEEVQGALSDARAEAGRMGRLVSDLLLLAHADSTQQMQQLDSSSSINDYKNINQEIDLDSLLLEAFRQYRPIEANSGSNNIEGPQLILQHITPAKVHGNADQLKQALVALVDNALKYTPYEGSVTLSLTTDERSAIVKVSDTGIGIHPDDLPHIFERFYRADRTRSRDRGGSGLGLAIVQSIVREHEGSIEVESTPGKGSTFTVKWPIV